MGSKQWIGAIELGYVLDTRLGVACKVLSVPSGADIESKARELAQHFDAQVWPISCPEDTCLFLEVLQCCRAMADGRWHGGRWHVLLDLLPAAPVHARMRLRLRYG